MGSVPEERAIARSDEPEARSAARWRGRAGREAAGGLVERWPALGSCPLAVRWLELQANVGRSPRTVEVYARSLVDYLGLLRAGWRRCPRCRAGRDRWVRSRVA
ncbi:MAG TPA: hypothetical protein VME22_14405 [Solirubrobacteraceae bacterium]|nr:hypothetical protein [Solirubrobacteraceae bacterium]